MNNTQESKQKRLIKPGSIFRLGNHIIACGDSRDKDFVAKVISTSKVDMVCCDIPYGISVVQSKAGFQQSLSKPKDIANDQFQSDEEYKKFNYDWLMAIRPHLSPKNAVYIFNADKMVFALREGLISAGYKFSQLLIWVKSHAVIGRLDYLPQHEIIVYGWFGTHKFYKETDRSVLFCPKPSKSKLHPTMKPISLLRRLILNSTKINDVIYDGFLGSGSLAIAAEQTQRHSIGIDIDPEYCETAITRLERLTNKRAELIS